MGETAGKTEHESAVTAEQAGEIEALRAQVRETRRATVAAMEEILYRPLPVLDHGFVRVIDYMGDDAAIVQASIRRATLCSTASSTFPRASNSPRSRPRTGRAAERP